MNTIPDSKKPGFRWLRVAIALLFCFRLVGSAPAIDGRAPSVAPRPIVLLISLDGFRWDYLNRGVSPNINKLAAEGVRAKSLIPAYPSETFPNHYSIVTGVYPQRHGIVKNNMYDPDFNAEFSMGRNAAESRWWGAEPIWVTAEKQGQTSAVFFWPGSEAEVEGTRPRYWKKFDDKLPNGDRVKQVLSWLALPEDERPSFAAIYFSDVDHAGHEFGPDSTEVNAAVKAVDRSVGQLVEGLKAQNLADHTTVIVVSDHGMASTSPRQRVYLSDYLDLSLLQKGRQFSGTNVLIWPVSGKEGEVYRALGKVPHLKVYRKEDTPEYFHYRDNRRIAPIVAVVDEGWRVETDHDPQQRGESAASGNRTTGAHGYDPRLPSMQGIFVAAGPPLKQQVVIDSFQNVQIYGLICRILNLKPASNDGNPGWSDPLLKR